MNKKGRPISGMISAASEIDLYNQLQNVNLELLSCKELDEGKGGIFGVAMKRITLRDLIQLFVHLDQMYDSSVPVLDALADIRDTTENPRLRDVMSEVYRDVNEGTSLSEAMARHPKVFSNIYISLIAAGEESGDMGKPYKQLIKYLKWRDDMGRRVKKAMMYPAIVSVVVVLAVVTMMTVVVPQIMGFIEEMQRTMDLEVWGFTTSLQATSAFFVAWWWAILGLPILLVILFATARHYSDELRYRIDALKIKLPVAGSLIRKINIARFSQTFAALYISGVDVIKALKSARHTVTNEALNEAMENVQSYVQTGSPLSEALNASGEFPSMVIRMVKIGEESGNLNKVLDQVGEFYTRDVDDAVQTMITFIEPLLTFVLALILIWIALGVFGPIYNNLGQFM